MFPTVNAPNATWRYGSQAACLLSRRTSEAGEPGLGSGTVGGSPTPITAPGECRAALGLTARGVGDPIPPSQRRATTGISAMPLAAIWSRRSARRTLDAGRVSAKQASGRHGVRLATRPFVVRPSTTVGAQVMEAEWSREWRNVSFVEGLGSPVALCRQDVGPEPEPLTRYERCCRRKADRGESAVVRVNHAGDRPRCFTRNSNDGEVLPAALRGVLDHDLNVLRADGEVAVVDNLNAVPRHLLAVHSLVVEVTKPHLKPGASRSTRAVHLPDERGGRHEHAHDADDYCPRSPGHGEQSFISGTLRSMLEEIPESLRQLAQGESRGLDEARLVKRLRAAWVTDINPYRHLGPGFHGVVLWFGEFPISIDNIWEESTSPVADALDDAVELATKFDLLRRLHSALQDMDQVARAARTLAEAKTAWDARDNSGVSEDDPAPSARPARRDHRDGPRHHVCASLHGRPRTPPAFVATRQAPRDPQVANGAAAQRGCPRG